MFQKKGVGTRRLNLAASRDSSAVKSHSTILQRLRRQISLDYYTIPPATQARDCIIFRSLGGEPDELSYEPDIYGIQQIDSVDEETLLLFTSKSDKACLRDLFDSHCFMGEAEK